MEMFGGKCIDTTNILKLRMSTHAACEDWISVMYGGVVWCGVLMVLCCVSLCEEVMPLVLIGFKNLGMFCLLGCGKVHCIATREEKRVQWY